MLKDNTLTTEDGIQMMKDVNRLLVKDWAYRYKEYFQLLKDTDQPLVFHCTAGKDRTGLCSALTLYALGVDMETIYDVLTGLEKMGQITDLELEKRDGNKVDGDEKPDGLQIEVDKLVFSFAGLAVRVSSLSTSFQLIIMLFISIGASLSSTASILKR